MFFFFKQKTAYEMRISDWSSDVCSSDLLTKLIRVIPSGKRLIGLPMNVEYKALAAEGKTAHGLSPVVVILDELGQVRGSQDPFVEALETAQGAYDDGLQLVISTQAPTDADKIRVASGRERVG